MYGTDGGALWRPQRQRITLMSRSSGSPKSLHAGTAPPGLIALGTMSSTSSGNSLGKSASAGQLKLPPLARVENKPLVFEEFFKKAKRRVTNTGATGRLEAHNAIVERVNDIALGNSTRSFSSSTLGKIGTFGKGANSSVKASLYPPLTDAEQAWARSAIKGIEPQTMLWEEGEVPLLRTGITTMNLDAQLAQPSLVQTLKEPQRLSMPHAFDGKSLEVDGALNRSGSGEHNDKAGGRRGDGRRPSIITRIGHVLGQTDLREAVNHQLSGGSDAKGAQDPQKLLITFQRFLREHQSELEASDLPKVLKFLGYMVNSDDLQKALEETTKFATLDFDEFAAFADKYVSMEHARLKEMFDGLDKSGEGSLDMEELAEMLTTMGITPLRKTLEEAALVVHARGDDQTFKYADFTALLVVYRTTEGFTLGELEELKKVFDRFATVREEPPPKIDEPPRPPPEKELHPDQLAEALMYMFGPQSQELATKIVRYIMGPPRSEAAVDEMDGGLPPEIEGEPTVVNPVEFREFLRIGRTVREAEIEEYKRIFEQFQDENGELDAESLREVVRAVGYLPLQDMIDDFVDQADETKDGMLDFSEFFNLMISFRNTDGFPRGQVSEFKAIFDCYDNQETGEVSCVQLKDILVHMGFPTKLDTVRKLIAEVDFNGNGTLDFREFLHLLRLRREAQLKHAQEVFSANEAYGGILEVDVIALMGMLTELDCETSVGDVNEILNNLGNPTEMTFEDFVQVLDLCMRTRALRLRHNAGFMEDEFNHLREKFDQYDQDKNDGIEKNELTTLLNDMGIPVRTQEEQEEVITLLSQARKAALLAGVKSEDLPTTVRITFPLLLHLARMLQRKVEQDEADTDDAAMEETGFTPPEVADFRQIFEYWALRTVAADDPQGLAGVVGEDRKEELRKRIPSDDFTPNDMHALKAAGIDCDALLVSVTGIRRVLRSLGVRTGLAETDALEAKMLCYKSVKKKTDEQTGCSESQIRFPDFLRLMKWMMDENFASINDAAAAAAGAAGLGVEPGQS